jgi:hypothetical protein
MQASFNSRQQAVDSVSAAGNLNHYISSPLSCNNGEVLSFLGKEIISNIAGILAASGTQ